ncbi:hypothetical protein BC831DRAFT_452575 [Entophlyctis helioformis]|nr:hypothetical protein BC831DRAFT_452575 [Entophlyctis helioformis]
MAGPSALRQQDSSGQPTCNGAWRFGQRSRTDPAARSVGLVGRLVGLAHLDGVVAENQAGNRSKQHERVNGVVVRLKHLDKLGPASQPFCRTNLESVHEKVLQEHEPPQDRQVVLDAEPQQRVLATIACTRTPVQVGQHSWTPRPHYSQRGRHDPLRVPEPCLQSLVAAGGPSEHGEHAMIARHHVMEQARARPLEDGDWQQHDWVVGGLHETCQKFYMRCDMLGIVVVDLGLACWCSARHCLSDVEQT